MNTSGEESEEKLQSEIKKEVEKLKYYVNNAGDEIIEKGDYNEVKIINSRAAVILDKINTDISCKCARVKNRPRRNSKECATMEKGNQAIVYTASGTNRKINGSLQRKTTTNQRGIRATKGGSRTR